MHRLAAEQLDALHPEPDLAHLLSTPPPPVSLQLSSPANCFALAVLLVAAAAILKCQTLNGNQPINQLIKSDEFLSDT